MYTRSSLRHGEAARKRGHEEREKEREKRKVEGVLEKVAKMLCFENDQMHGLLPGRKVKNVRALRSRWRVVALESFFVGWFS